MQPKALGREYFQGTYPADHWAVQPYTLKDQKVLALAIFKGSEYAIYLNPTDKRGYRSIVRFVNNQDMPSSVNRDYTSQERIGLGLLSQLVAEAYSQIVPIAQTAVAGNNSHKFDEASGTTYLGIAQEPSFLHAHIIGRGNPQGQYVENVALDGPKPGLNFDMMAKTPSEVGNDKKVQWKEGDMAKVANRLKSEIDKVKLVYEEYGLQVTTEL